MSPACLPPLMRLRLSLVSVLLSAPEPGLSLVLTLVTLVSWKDSLAVLGAILTLSLSSLSESVTELWVTGYWAALSLSPALFLLTLLELASLPP